MKPVEGEFLRGVGPVAVLKLLECGQMYGYEIVEALEKRTEGVLAMGQSQLTTAMEALGLTQHITGVFT